MNPIMLILLSGLLFSVASCGDYPPQALHCALKGCTDAYRRDQRGENPEDETKNKGETGETGPMGPRGTRGQTGAPGTPGENGADGQTGPSGPSGDAGEDGEDGADGLSVAISILNTAPGCVPLSGITILLAQDVNNNASVDIGIDNNIQSGEVCNGEDGEDAPPTPFTPSELVDFCGDAPGVFDEVAIRLANNMLVASFSDNANGNNTRFSVLTPGTYRTTDGSNCFFTIDSNLAVINEHY